MRYRALLDIAQMGESAALSRLERVKGWEQRDNPKREAVKSFWGRWFDKPFAYAVKASELTDEEKREFIVKDNAAFGEWDWDALANGWDAADLNAWSVNLPIMESEINPDEFFDKVENEQEKEKGDKITVHIPSELADEKDNIKSLIEEALADYSDIKVK